MTRPFFFGVLIFVLDVVSASGRPVKYYHPAGHDIICHAAYCLDYAPEYGQARWTAYLLTRKAVVEGREKRSNNFRPDPAVREGSADPDDYHGSGYDMGHLVPAADMKWSKLAMSQTFFMSNMSPQRPSFNRGIWKYLEKAVRDWAVQNDTLYVTTGPVLQKDLPFIGWGRRVSVPELYYKVILDYAKPEIKAIAFIMPNEKSRLPIMSYAMTVDSVEKVTGIDFFPGLPEAIERKVESELNPALWPIMDHKRRARDSSLILHHPAP